MFNGNEEDPYFIATHNEVELFRKFRKISEADQKEIEIKIINLAMKCSENKK
mgnify:CR=1 FL=1